MKALIAGCGWLGSAVAEALTAAGHHVIGVRRSPDAAAALTRLGIEPLIVDLTAHDAAAALPADADVVVACPSADRSDADAYRAAYVDAVRPLLELTRRRPVMRLVYVGSTGVFGQRDGGWVDETTPPEPADETGRVLLEAERRVLEPALAEGRATCVLRLSGLYGPGRYGLVERVRDGRLALGPGDETWTNWCHRTDAVRAVVAALDTGRPGAMYHASDEQPLRRRDVVAWIAGRLCIEPPQLAATARLVPAGNRRGANRRIAAARTRAELGLALAFPSLFDGLSEVLDSPAAS